MRDEHLERSDAVEDLFRKHYVAMVRTARLLLGNREEGEEVVQEAFVALYRGWHRLRDQHRALPYLHATVVNLARGRLRHAAVTRRHKPGPEPHVDPPDPGLASQELKAIRAAVASLPDRQREAVVLRFLSGLDESEVARAMGISTGALKSHLHRARVSLSERLGAYR